MVGATGSQGATGVTGQQGATGATASSCCGTGPAGQSVLGVIEAPGANCVNGGVKYASATGVNYVCDGVPGTAGVDGAIGSTGMAGATGDTGSQGIQRVQGEVGAIGPIGPQGTKGDKGDKGNTGDQGPQGPAGGTMSFGHFFALMPGDNSATVAVGTAVEFPQNGEANGIIRASASEFTPAAIGTYEIFWQVSISEAGQLVLGLDSGAGVMEQSRTVAGRAALTSQITNQVLLATTVTNSILTVRNPAGNSTALTVTQTAGGTSPVSASLVIKQLK